MLVKKQRLIESYLARLDPQQREDEVVLSVVACSVAQQNVQVAPLEADAGVPVSPALVASNARPKRHFGIGVWPRFSIGSGYGYGYPHGFGGYGYEYDVYSYGHGYIPYLTNRGPYGYYGGNSTIKSNIVFKDLVTADNISAKKINNLNMSDIAWKTIAPGQIITGKKHLNGTMDIQGDITVDLLNAVNITDYNEASLNQLIANASARIAIPEIEPKILHERTPAIPLLRSLRRSKGKLSSFEFFEQIQQIPFSFPHGSNLSMHIQHCPIPTRKQSSTSDTTAGILVATHSTDENNCKLKKFCRCHHSVTLPSDTNGYLNTLRISTRLKDYLEENLIYGDRVRLLHSRDQLFVLTIESLSSCLPENVSIGVFNPFTFKLLRETVVELNDIVADVALERRNEDGVVILAISHRLEYGYTVLMAKHFNGSSCLKQKQWRRFTSVPITRRCFWLLLRTASKPYVPFGALTVLAQTTDPSIPVNV
ncbi:hypothetical protein GHT06_012268 [Daphnia sinensis]|uniref:Uncharacterized protein n=1 Tax=Daphnia sinensis TaxID=1820382 RepID=A0AAD5KVK4_9CRUS|nr:hypothetical protein GHT06_012268 [Daphnia sinensis]